MGIFDRFKKEEQDNANIQAAAVKPAKSSDTKKDEKSDKKSDKGKKKEKGLPADLVDVILHPLVTEKAATMTSLSKYVFVVKPSANRVQVRNAVRKMYGVNPISVNIINMRGKEVRFGRKRGKRKDWKKAMVTFPKGTTIDAYDGV